MRIGQIFYLKDYDEACNFCYDNNCAIKEIEADENGRKFIISAMPERTKEDILNGLRAEREHICFDIINRGLLWYETLTEQQRKELEIWYHAWLDVTETMVIPEKPSWLGV